MIRYVLPSFLPSFLPSLWNHKTEELEEGLRDTEISDAIGGGKRDASGTYDDYKFLTMQEVRVQTDRPMEGCR